MRIRGLDIYYHRGVNTVFSLNGKTAAEYPVGGLLCRIFQGDTLKEIIRPLISSINICPFSQDELTQDSIESAERYILTALTYNEFYPAQILSQGSFIRCAEIYRALDSETAEKMLRENTAIISEDSEDGCFFRDIGFDTVGGYLRMCFNSYYIDLVNGLNLFNAMAAIKSETATRTEASEFKTLCSQLSHVTIDRGIELQIVLDPEDGSFREICTLSSFLSMAVFEFSHIAETKAKICRCQNPECGKFFTARKSNAKYCGFPSPQNPDRTCCQYYPQIAHHKKVMEDSLDHIEKNAQSRLRMYRKRNPNRKDEVNGLIRRLQSEGAHMKDEVRDSKMTVKQYSEWVDALHIPKGESEDDK